jgi:hypothetical protein
MGSGRSPGGPKPLAAALNPYCPAPPRSDRETAETIPQPAVPGGPTARAIIEVEGDTPFLRMNSTAISAWRCAPRSSRPRRGGHRLWHSPRRGPLHQRNPVAACRVGAASRCLPPSPGRHAVLVGPDRHDNDVAGAKCGHAKTGDEISRTVDAGKAR